MPSWYAGQVSSGIVAEVGLVSVTAKLTEWSGEMVSGTCEMVATSRDEGGALVVLAPEVPPSRGLKSTRAPPHWVAIRAFETCSVPVGNVKPNVADSSRGFPQSYGELTCTCTPSPGLS